MTTLGPAALATSPTTLSVMFQNPGVTANASTSGCILHNLQGTPNSVSVTHNTLVASGGPTGAASFYNDIVPPLNELAMGQTLQNNLLVAFWPETSQGGGFNSSNGEGTRTLSTAFDGSSLAFNNNVLAGRALGGTVNCSASSNTCTLVSGDAPNGQSGRMTGENVLINGTSYAATGVTGTTITFSSPDSPGTLTGAS